MSDFLNQGGSMEAIRRIASVLESFQQTKGNSPSANSDIVTVLQQLVNATASVADAINTKFPNWVAVPTTATDPGVAGQVAFEPGFLYVCVSSGTWQRVALTTF